VDAALSRLFESVESRSGGGGCAGGGVDPEVLCGLPVFGGSGGGGGADQKPPASDLSPIESAAAEAEAYLADTEQRLRRISASAHAATTAGAAAAATTATAAAATAVATAKAAAAAPAAMTVKMTANPAAAAAADAVMAGALKRVRAANGSTLNGRPCRYCPPRYPSNYWITLDNPGSILCHPMSSYDVASNNWQALILGAAAGASGKPTKRVKTTTAIRPGASIAAAAAAVVAANGLLGRRGSNTSSNISLDSSWSTAAAAPQAGAYTRSLFSST